ncbi:hypothetical protein PTKIN_Ptkin06aG0176600 [Pterospermum kingtungense]
MVRSRSMKKQKRMAHLPEDLVLTEIMTRLPPKSILRFRCLSKSWKVSLSSPDFITRHLNRVQECQYDDMQHLILRSTDCSLQSINCEAYKKTASNLDLPSKYSHHNCFPDVLGSCNGLLCVALSRKTLILWNPSIKEFKELPLSSPLDDGNEDRFGFGYDRSANDYKVIRFVNATQQPVGLSTSWSANLYSLKSNTWKIIQGVPADFLIDKMPGTLVDGVLYWIVIYSHEEWLFPSWILGFDIAFEKFDIVPTPDGTNNGFDWTLGMIGGSLSLAQNLEEGIFEMWKLEKKGANKHGWIKVITIKKNMQTSPSFRCLVPIWVMKNGEVLTYQGDWPCVKRSNKLKLYDPVKGTFRKLIVGGLKQWSQAISYTESLVSPNSDDTRQGYAIDEVQDEQLLF